MIRIFTDNAANLPSNLRQQYQIGTVSLRYTVEDQPADPGTFDGPAFYDAMRRGAEVRTSMISPGEAEAALEEVLAAGDDVLFCSISGGISGSCWAIKMAAQRMQKKYPHSRIHVLDTRGASLGEGIPVLLAAECVRAGGTWQQVLDCAEKACQEMCQYFVVDDLKYLRRGGRVSGAAAMAGTLLHIKPILWGNEEGKIVVHDKVRGKRRAVEYLAALYREKCTDPAAPVGIAHADCAGDALHLHNLLRQAGQTGPILSEMYEPVTGSHVGPGTLALFFRGPKRD